MCFCAEISRYSRTRRETDSNFIHIKNESQPRHSSKNCNKKKTLRT
ncbi:hypothetical protein HMPREF9347_02119 [Escherichia coli MS 124-1]|nr:hypothetical protein HMPREF9540_03266 [Escherichia coli MS 115-1]EFK16552.1 hypothetical protein HMPREF9541_01050 [Escherichia coli MS 116-1]EFK52313.1 hypothetical protein HMPREF9345_01084 [Escherichia coli MS 107-1]EFK69010.1 hypothetical protein HMPREF9347_02119 [Escherichia coli MS 124-1]EGB89052.1 hypothetical protein HMPREF9542_01464 [Escherichia coli MS 117-3]EGU99867.1 hypothetical protein HMPREF9349_00089 [Escherichia coli MS 79-10]